jgi:hypothetical protein
LNGFKILFILFKIENNLIQLIVPKITIIIDPSGSRERERERDRIDK